MSTLTREERLMTFGELTKLPGVKRASVYADELAGSCNILIDHPLSGRPWTIDAEDSVAGFYHLSTSVVIGKDYETERVQYQRFELCLYEDSFERIQ